MSLNFDSNQNHFFFNKKDSVPLVFIHGVGLDHQMWSPQIDNLNEFSTITYDLLGHGKTPNIKEKLTLKDFSEQLLDILDYINICLLYTSPSPRDRQKSRMPSSA